MNLRRNSIFGLLLVCLVALPQIASAASPNIVISQVYGAGGNSGATYRNDYIELFNRSTSPVSVTGWSVQYTSSSGTGLFSSGVTPLSGTIAPGQYYLVQESSGGANGILIPPADVTGTLAMAAGAGKVALVSSTTGLACNGSTTPCSPAQLAQIVDLVGYGSGTTFFEGSGPTGTISTTNAAFRKLGGCTDTDNNAGDFTVAAAGPRNTASAFNVCPGGNLPPVINAPANPIATVNQDAAPFTVSLSGSDDNNLFTWAATAGAGISSVVVTGGQGTANVTYTVTLQAGFNGPATFTASLSDSVNAPTTQAVNIQVNPLVVNNPPAITAPANPITTVVQDAAPFTVSLSGSDDNGIFNWSATAGSGVSSAVVTAGQGTSSVTYTVTLQAGFSGTATFTARLSDNVNPIVTQAVNIAVTPAPLTHLTISQIYGGGGNSGATYQNDYVELHNATAGPIDTAGWSIQYGSATGTAWQAQPLGGIIQPGEYYLISLASGGAVGAPLPLANINGSLNLSATAGKVALVSGGVLPSGCPTGNPNLVDLVGYGTTANCFEGASRAPGASNTTAIFRKSGGATDTNVNGSDFVTGAPNPRRTTPIQEIGPSVLDVDTSNNTSSAPRDASITVTFTEDVTVSGAWFNISCVSSGLHNDATTASAFGGSSWIIIPNVNFLAGEQCTATVYKNFVFDVDVDDAGPNTDTLPADYSWTFTVATGTLPPYTPDVHLTFGNPSGAVNDTLQPNNYLMEKGEFSLSYNRDRGTPNWVSWHLTDEWVGTLSRVDTFRADPAVSPDWYRVTHVDYQNSGFDRGHMVPNADRDKETSIPINQATFLMSNMIPQAPDNNQGPWADLENDLRALLPSNELYIVAGGSGTGGTGSNGFATTIANGNVTVPEKTWKCALVLPKMSGNDVLRVTAATQTICVIMPNIQGIRNDDWHIYLTSVDAVEVLSGYDLFANIPDAIENAVEAGVNGANPPGVDDSSVTTDEDNAALFTLDVASPNNNPLTYTFTGPSHGSLSGSGANRTYTPAPDYYGADSFTFTVNDGTRTSNTGTVSITVNPVNDAPSAANDAKSTNEDTTLQFPASDLTGNDSTGPANENTQALVVTSVGAAAHGAASLSGGIVTYLPNADYNGSDAFTYQVCDDGTPSLCATATVNITVNPVNDAPSASISVPSSTAEGSGVTATVSVTDADDSSFTYAWTVTKNGSPYASGSSNSINFTPDDDGAYDVSVTVSDAGNASGSDLETVTATNVAPAITSISGPAAPLQLGAGATVNATYVDPGTADTHTANLTWDDASSSTVSCSGGTCTASHTYAAAGVYEVTMVVSDDDGGSDSATFSYVVVVDSNGRFVTGSGSLSTITGPATFAIDAKYVKNQSAPVGKTTFKVGGSELKSTSYDWLVATATQSQYQGSATINGSGSYGFMVTAYDGSPDKFRIRVWDKTTLATVYDNVPGAPDDIDTAAPQAIGSGNIVIH
jgi:endonuclease G